LATLAIHSVSIALPPENNQAFFSRN